MTELRLSRRPVTRALTTTKINVPKTPMPREALLEEIGRACGEYGVTTTSFGIASTKDPRLVSDIRRGRQPGLRVQRKVLAYIASLGREVVA